MSTFGNPPQGSVSAGNQPGLVAAVPPEGLAPKSGSRRLLVVAIAFLSLLLVTGVVFLLFVLGASRSHSEPSLANGLKVSLDKLVVIQVESDDEDVVLSHPYSVFLPEDKLAVFAPVGEKVYYNVVRQDTGGKVSPSKAKISWPEDADESSGALEPCESGQRYALEANAVTCAKVDAPKMADKKMGFGQVLYSGKDLKIVASPSIDNARALSGFSPDGKLLWSKELATPGQVSLEGSNIIVTSFEDSKVSIEGYGAVEESQKPAESPTLVEATKGSGKDAIKDFDYMNNFALGAGDPDKTDCTYYNDDGSPVFRKIPDENDGCWLTVVDGESQEGSDEYPEQREPWLFFDAPDSSYHEYTDFNSDGFLDLLLTGRNHGSPEEFVYIFDPADPEHPYVAHIPHTGGSEDGEPFPFYRGEGLFETEISIVDEDDELEPCVRSRFRIENDANGVPHVVDYEEVDDDATDEEGCL